MIVLVDLTAFFFDQQLNVLQTRTCPRYFGVLSIRSPGAVGPVLLGALQRFINVVFIGNTGFVNHGTVNYLQIFDGVEVRVWKKTFMFLGVCFGSFSCWNTNGSSGPVWISKTARFSRIRMLIWESGVTIPFMRLLIRFRGKHLKTIIFLPPCFTVPWMWRYWCSLSDFPVEQHAISTTISLINMLK